jgi:hypothetical protein
MSWAPAKVLMPSELQEMSQKLRGDDNRLFRPSPTEATAMAQNEVCPNEIPSLVETLHASNLTLRTRGNAAEVLQLCTTNNPRNRAKIGSVRLPKRSGYFRTIMRTTKKDSLKQVWWMN